MLLGSEHKKLDKLCQNQIVIWISNYNNSYTLSTENEREIIKSLIFMKNIFLTQKLQKELLFLVT